MKRMFAGLVAMLAILACKNTIPVEDPDKGGRANEEVVRQMFAHFNRHDWPAMAAMYAPRAAFKDPSFGQGEVWQSRQETVAKYQQLATLFPDVQDSLLQVVAAGHKQVVAEFVSTGTGPDGQRFRMPICTLFTIDSGRIVKDYTYYDDPCPTPAK